MGLFFRSKKRDRQTDAARLVPILDAVQRALREADAELTGLRLRLSEKGEQAAWLIGTDYLESDADGDPRSEAELAEAESYIKRGRIRQRYLDAQVKALTAAVSVL